MRLASVRDTPARAEGPNHAVSRIRWVQIALTLLGRALGVNNCGERSEDRKQSESGVKESRAQIQHEVISKRH